MNTAPIENVANSVIAPVNASAANCIELTVIEAATSSKNARQQETYHKMIERVKEYHSKLDISQHSGKGKVNLFVCCICFNIFSEQNLLRDHFIKVSI